MEPEGYKLLEVATSDHFYSQIQQKAEGNVETLDQGPAEIKNREEPATLESRNENGEVIDVPIRPVIRCHSVDSVGSSLAPLIYFQQEQVQKRRKLQKILRTRQVVEEADSISL